jgi:hypothetical protein
VQRTTTFTVRCFQGGTLREKRVLMNGLEPWVLVRLALSALAVALVGRASLTCVRVLRSFAVARASEGQLLLERNMMLATLLVRAAVVVQGVALVLSFLVANSLYPQIEGAMCGYGVIAATPYGEASLVSSLTAALCAGAVGGVLAFDARSQDLRFARPVAILVLALLPVVVTDAALTALHRSALDLSVVTTCCSLEVGESVRVISGAAAYGSKALLMVPFALLMVSVLLWIRAAQVPKRGVVRTVSVSVLLLLPLLALFVVQITAPHVFEVPHHRCPFCLFRADAWYIGYGTFGGALLLGTVAASFLGEDPAWTPFARDRLRLGAASVALASAIAIAPVLRYLLLSGGHLL